MDGKRCVYIGRAYGVLASAIVPSAETHQLHARIDYIGSAKKEGEADLTDEEIILTWRVQL